jgi:N-acylneuraminate cytidylyltransferase
METGHRFFGRIGLVETDTPPVEIDEPRDIPVLEALMAAPQAPEAPVAPEPLPARPDLIVFDFDGVMTDDRLIVREDGLESVICSRADGMGIERLRLAGHPMAVLSKEKNAVVMARCAKLGIECLQDIEDKATQLVALAESRRLDLDKIVYVGNDINDLAPMRLVGWPVAPADARPEIIHAARVVLPAPGGRGAVRALSDMILDRHGEQK